MVVKNSASEDAEGSEEHVFGNLRKGALLCSGRKLRRIVSSSYVESITCIQLNWTYS